MPDTEEAAAPAPRRPRRRPPRVTGELTRATVTPLDDEGAPSGPPVEVPIAAATTVLHVGGQRYEMRTGNTGTTMRPLDPGAEADDVLNVWRATTEGHVLVFPLDALGWPILTDSREVPRQYVSVDNPVRRVMADNPQHTEMVTGVCMHWSATGVPQSIVMHPGEAARHLAHGGVAIGDDDRLRIDPLLRRESSGVISPTWRPPDRAVVAPVDAADELLGAIDRALANYRRRFANPVPVRTWRDEASRLYDHHPDDYQADREVRWPDAPAEVVLAELPVDRAALPAEVVRDAVPADPPRTVFAFNVDRRLNADAILDAHRLKYLRNDDVILDATFGRGAMWAKWRPLRGRVLGNDLWTEAACEAHDDFRWLGHPDRWFDAVVFDPPYKLNGTPTNMGGMDERYGVLTYTRWQDRYALIEDGLVECARVCKRHLLVKCMDQVVSGKVRWQTIDFTNHVHTYTGFELVDQIHVPGSREQPGNRRQVHARRNYSTLLVFQRCGTEAVVPYTPVFTRARTNDGAWCVTNGNTGAQEVGTVSLDGEGNTTGAWVNTNAAIGGSRYSWVDDDGTVHGEF